MDRYLKRDTVIPRNGLRDHNTGPTEAGRVDCKICKGACGRSSAIPVSRLAVDARLRQQRDAGCAYVLMRDPVANITYMAVLIRTYRWRAFLSLQHIIDEVNPWLSARSCKLLCDSARSQSLCSAFNVRGDHGVLSISCKYRQLGVTRA